MDLIKYKTLYNFYGFIKIPKIKENKVEEKFILWYFGLW